MLKMPLLAPEKICTPFDILHLKFSVGNLMQEKCGLRIQNIQLKSIKHEKEHISYFIISSIADFLFLWK